MSLITIKNESELPQVAQQILQQCHSKTIVFIGQMGAGKTTLIKELCKQLGVKDQTSSPTFAIINEYRDKQNKPIYHFDLYRLKNLNEVFDLGYEDYFYSGHYCFVEWPQIMEKHLPPNYCTVKIDIEGASRVFTIS